MFDNLLRILSGSVLLVVLATCDKAPSAAATMDMPMPAIKPATTAPATAPAPNTVVIDNFAFSPAALTVSAGTKVTWINHDDVPHTVTSTTKPRILDSGSLDTDDHYSFTFTTSGTYKYFCLVHTQMTGTVIVK